MYSRAKWQHIHHFGKLNVPEKRMILAAATVLPMTTLGLRLFGLKRWHAALQWWAQCSRWRLIEQDEFASVRRTMKLMYLVVHHAPHSGNCLSQSLTLWWLLQCQGIESNLRIGVRNTNSLFQAHAWVEYQGSPLNDGRDVYDRFVVFDRPILAKETKTAEIKGNVR